MSLIFLCSIYTKVAPLKRIYSLTRKEKNKSFFSIFNLLFLLLIWEFHAFIEYIFNIVTHSHHQLTKDFPLPPFLTWYPLIFHCQYFLYF